MTREKILHVYSDAWKEEQKETWEAFSLIEPEFHVDHVHVLRDTDYGDTIKRNWGKGTTSLLWSRT